MDGHPKVLRDINRVDKVVVIVRIPCQQCAFAVHPGGSSWQARDNYDIIIDNDEQWFETAVGMLACTRMSRAVYPERLFLFFLTDCFIVDRTSPLQGAGLRPTLSHSWLIDLIVKRLFLALAQWS